MNKKYTFIFIVMLLFATCTSGLAYVTYGKWSSNNIKMQASATSFPYGDSYRTALSTVAYRYYFNPSCAYFSQLFDDQSVSLGNGENEVWFSPDPQYFPACTIWWTSPSGQIVETDVIFCSLENYTTSMIKLNLSAYGGAWRPFETTAIHEYGHAAGLHHEADEYNVMGTDFTHIHCNGPFCRSYVGEDACDGLVSLYGLTTGKHEDVSVTLFKYSGVNGQYSTHDKCKMYNSSFVELPWTSLQGQRCYNVSKKQTVYVELTWENQGKNGQSPNVGWYLSTDNNITTADNLIATSSYMLYRDDVCTWLTKITLPMLMTSGKYYYLGAIVDYDNKIQEVDENNNAAYHIIKVN